MTSGAAAPEPIAVEPAAALWEELTRLAGRESGERAYLARLLEHWRRARGAAGAAFYACREGACRRELVAGAGRFPEAVEGEAPAQGFTALRLPEALVLALPGGAAGAGETPIADAEPLELLLAAVARCLALERRLKEQHFQVNYRGVELEALYDVGLAVASTLDLDELSEEILVRAVSLLDARRGALYLREGEEYRLDGTFGGAAAEAFPADLPALEECLEGEGACPAELLPGARHLMLVPIESDRRRRGVLVVGDKESRRGIGPFGADDRRTLSLFANQAAIAIENARLHRQALEKERLEREMELAAEIQRQILPDVLPEVAGWELAGWNRPARQVGGDYYDLVRLGESGRLGFAVGDVTGKGMPAALLVSTLHSALALLRDRGELSPELVARLNRHVCESSLANKFITLILGELDPASGRLTYVNAGHNPGFVVRAGGAVERLGSTGLPLGLMPAGVWSARGVELGAGDLVCLYTDGITECASPADEELGEERLLGLLAAHRGAPLAELVAAVDRATVDHAAGLPQGDDQTLVLVRRAAG
jgi:sigma-B regulation protein RsbU (phosphoserine phosphatase)